jgi:hypothetical protein
MLDWTVALDDSLVQRWSRCVLCLRRDPDGKPWLDIVDVRGFGVAVLRCQACFRQPGSLAEVEAVLAQRYGAASNAEPT